MGESAEKEFRDKGKGGRRWLLSHALRGAPPRPAPGMGLDGGTIPSRTDILRGDSSRIRSSRLTFRSALTHLVCTGSSWRLARSDSSRSTRGGSIAGSKFRSDRAPTRADAAAAECARLSTCALSGEPLAAAIRACSKDQLYNANAVAALVAKARPQRDPRFSHISSVERDTFAVKWAGSRAAQPGGPDSPWICPATGLVADGRNPFVALSPCGHVVSQKAVRSIQLAVVGKKRKRNMGERSTRSTANACLIGCPVCGSESKVVRLGQPIAHSASDLVAVADRKASSLTTPSALTVSSASKSSALVASKKARAARPKFRPGTDVLVLASNGKVWNPAVVIEARPSRTRPNRPDIASRYRYTVEYSNGHTSEKKEAELRALSKAACPRGHTLRRFLTYTAGFRCDACKRVNLPEGFEMYGCRRCDWDLCFVCYRAETQQLGDEQKAVKTRAQGGPVRAGDALALRSVRRKKDAAAEAAKLKLLEKMGGKWTRQ